MPRRLAGYLSISPGVHCVLVERYKWIEIALGSHFCFQREVSCRKLEPTTGAGRSSLTDLFSRAVTSCNPSGCISRSRIALSCGNTRSRSRINSTHWPIFCGLAAREPCTPQLPERRESCEIDEALSCSSDTVSIARLLNGQESELSAFPHAMRSLHNR